MVTLGRKMKIIREARAISQWDLAVKLGIDRSRISLIENGYVAPTDSEVARIREALAWTPEMDEIIERLAALPAQQ